LNNTVTTTYTFTPDAGQCATTETMTITVTPNVTPTFIPVPDICSGATLSALPTTSNNGIIGTWSPALNNTATTTYAFTPNSGQCASSQIMTITVDPLITPTFNQIARICKGTILSALPTNSNNGISGTWSPELNNNITTTYTFTPDSNQCASNFEMIIDVFDINTYPIPKGISPNGDGKNENWDLISIDVITLKLYNRYGQLVYEKKNYTNEWFGQNNNSQSLPDGTYFYVLHLECGTKTGWVYINK
jgi:gliding motility-associated-like protein